MREVIRYWDGVKWVDVTNLPYNPAIVPAYDPGEVRHLGDTRRFEASVTP